MIRSLLRGMLLLAVMKIASADVGLLNVSYDVTREFYKEFNPAFAAYWKKKTGETVNLYPEEGQEPAARNCFRPRDAKILARDEATFRKLDLVTVDEVFGGWKQAQAVHFKDGGLFDQIYQVK